MAGEFRVWKLGDQCRIKCGDGRTVDATVRLASPNGMSLALEFEAIIGGWVAMMPLVWSQQRERYECFQGEAYELLELQKP